MSKQKYYWIMKVSERGCECVTTTTTRNPGTSYFYNLHAAQLNKTCKNDFQQNFSVSVPWSVQVDGCILASPTSFSKLSKCLVLKLSFSSVFSNLKLLQSCRYRMPHVFSNRTNKKCPGRSKVSMFPSLKASAQSFDGYFHSERENRLCCDQQRDFNHLKIIVNLC